MYPRRRKFYFFVTTAAAQKREKYPQLEEPGSPRSNGQGFGSSPGKRDKYSQEIK
jgi:hypothetical protein